MTKPENIEQAFSGTAYPVDAATGKNPTIEAVKVALRRLLCPEPEQPAPVCYECWPENMAQESCPIRPGRYRCVVCGMDFTKQSETPNGAPPAPPPSPSPDATEKGGDRAREMAGKHITAAPNPVTDEPQIELWSKEGGEEICLQVNGMNYGDAVDIMRDWLARVIRAYGDELLEKAKAKLAQSLPDRMSGTAAWFSVFHVQRIIDSFKSTAAKGVANG